MKSVWHGHSTRPSLPAGTARKGSGHLSGRRPLHLANARPFGRLKAPLGLSLLRCAAQTRACLWQAEQAHHANNEKQEVPTGELPVVHIAIVCGFWQGASGWTHPVFVSSWLGVHQTASPQLLIGFFRHRLAPLVRGARKCRVENFRALAPDKNWNFDFLARLCHGGTIKGACV